MEYNSVRVARNHTYPSKMRGHGATGSFAIGLARLWPIWMLAGATLLLGQGLQITATLATALEKAKKANESLSILRRAGDAALAGKAVDSGGDWAKLAD